MKIHNSDITIKCPHSGVKFHPKRLNQLFYTPEDGWTFRNRLKRMKDRKLAERIKSNLNNLKIIVEILPNLEAFNKSKVLDIEGFDWEAAKRVVNPFTLKFNDTHKCYAVFGFLIQRKATRINIYDIRTSEILLEEF